MYLVIAYVTFRPDEAGTFVQMITLNIYTFKSKIPEVAKLFDVSNCFEGDEVQWFQLQFPVEAMNRTELKKSVPQIKAAVRSALGDIPPARMPEIAINFNKTAMTARIKLTDRPNYKQSFKLDANKVVEKSTQTKSFASESADDCARRCQLDRYCSGFSWCSSSTCTVFVQDAAQPATLPMKLTVT